MTSQNVYLRSFMQQISGMPNAWLTIPCENAKITEQLKTMAALWDLQAFDIYSAVCLALKTNNYSEEIFDDMRFALDMHLYDMTSLAKLMVNHSDGDDSGDIEDNVTELLDLKFSALISKLLFVNGDLFFEHTLKVFNTGDSTALLELLSISTDSSSSSSDADDSELEFTTDEGSGSDDESDDYDDNLGDDSDYEDDDESELDEQVLRHMDKFKLGDVVEFEIDGVEYTGCIFRFDRKGGMFQVVVPDGNFLIVHSCRCALARNEYVTSCCFVIQWLVTIALLVGILTYIDPLHFAQIIENNEPQNHI